MPTSKNQYKVVSILDSLQKMLSSSYALEETERIEISTATSRVLAQDVTSNLDAPPFDQASVDGIAFCSEDLTTSSTLKLTELPYSLKSGRFPECAKGECMQVSMGTPLPSRCDSVQKMNYVSIEGQNVHFNQVPQARSHVRGRGEEIQKGIALFSSGRRLGVADIGLLSNAGVHTIRVYRKAKVFLLSIGDGLRSAGAELSKGQRFDTNKYMLSALLSSTQTSLVDTASMSDDYAALAVMMKEAAAKSDLIILSGSISESNIDYMKRILKKEYKISSWLMKLQQGHSLIFGILETTVGKQTLFCSLPSHPASSLMTYCQLVQPMLDKLSGVKQYAALRFVAHLSQPIIPLKSHTNFLRGFCQTDTKGQLQVSAHEKQDELTLTSFVESNCFIILSDPTQALSAGDQVWIEYFPQSLL